MNREAEKSALHRFGGLGIAVSLLPGAVGVATKYWLRDDVTSLHLGLWETCKGTVCGSLAPDVVPGWFTAVRGLCVMTLCLHAISVVTGCCCGCLGSHSLNAFSFFPRLEEAAAFIAALLMGGALAVFTRCTETHAVFTNFHLDWSFWLCFTQALLLFICGGVVALTRDNCTCRKRRSETHENRTGPKRKQPIHKSLTDPQKWDCNRGFYDPVKKKDSMIFHEMPFKTSPGEGSFLAPSSSGDRRKFFSSYEGLPHLLQTLSPEKPKDVSFV